MGICADCDSLTVNNSMFHGFTGSRCISMCKSVSKQGVYSSIPAIYIYIYNDLGLIWAMQNKNTFVGPTKSKSHVPGSLNLKRLRACNRWVTGDWWKPTLYRLHGYNPESPYMLWN